jgi:membrane protein CcdC involved in cytochrome C biogenesis
MGHLMPFNLHTFAMFGVIVMGTTMMILRIRATKRPTSLKKILIPPLGMSTGFLMFLFPPFRIPLSWAFLAFAAGAIFFSIPLIRTSKLEVVNNEIYLKQSPAFVLILGILLLIRLSLHSYIEQHISLPQTGGLFFILAFGMLLPWRLAMAYKYKKLEKEIKQTSKETASE